MIKKILITTFMIVIIFVSSLYPAGDRIRKYPVTQPSGRIIQEKAYIGDNKVLLFSGCYTARNGETWIHDLSDNTWTNKNPSIKPSAQYTYDMAYIGDDQVLLFGYNTNSGSDETWIYDLSDNTWTDKNPITKPAGYFFYEMAYIGNNQVLLGGSYKDGFGDNKETWIYDLYYNIWTQDANTTPLSCRSEYELSATSMIELSYPVLFSSNSLFTADDETWTFADVAYLNSSLKVSSHSPDQNELYVAPVTSNVDVQLSGNIDGTTLNNDISFRVDNFMSVEYMSALFCGTNTITFDPTTYFEPSEMVTLTMTMGILSTSSFSLINPCTYQFAVASKNNCRNFGDQQEISNSADDANSVFAADIDGDGDKDVLSASWADDKIAWYENGNSWKKIVISNSSDGASSVYAADIDGDGDIDVFSTSEQGHKVSWYENGNSWNETVIRNDFYYAHSVFATDIDGDGDIDVLAASHSSNQITWYENGNLWNETVITNIADNVRGIYAADIDSDGDMDVLSASWVDDKIAWYENTDGSGTFGDQQVISTDGLGSVSVYAADFDGDGDMDVLSASFLDNEISWYENTDGKGTFGNQQIISNNVSYVQSVFAADIDGDYDVDVLSASSTDNKIAWYENTDGNGTFGAQQVISTNAKFANCVYAADIDNDGDMDVLSASSLVDDDKIAWHENVCLDFDDLPLVYNLTTIDDDAQHEIRRY